MSGLPNGWANVQLGQLTNPNRPRCMPSDFPNLKYIGLEHVESQTRRLLGVGDAKEMKSSVFHFQKKDVLYGRLRPYLNKVYCAEFEGLCSSEFIVLPQSEACDSKYLHYFLNTDGFVAFANHLNQGDRPRVHFEQISIQEIPLAPRNEQRRIVAKLEQVLGKVADCQARLEKIPKLLGRFRQSVLAAACSGRLTADWRDGNGIEAHKNEINFYENGDFETPISWKWTDLNYLCSKITDGEHLTPPLSNHGVPLLSAKNVREDYLDFSETKFVEFSVAQKSRSRCDPEKNDILVVSRGATVGRTCRVQVDELFCLMGSVLLFKLKKELIIPNFLEYIFKSPFGTMKLFSASGATAQQAIYIRDMRGFTLPLPPLGEQKIIINRVESLFKYANQLEARYRTAKANIDKLTQSILAKAFRGELVPQDPSDEPASVLLERIRAERNGQSPAPKQKRGPGAKKVKVSPPTEPKRPPKQTSLF
jgi:type I restriction enzyme, S subunit